MICYLLCLKSLISPVLLTSTGWAHTLNHIYLICHFPHLIYLVHIGSSIKKYLDCILVTMGTGYTKGSVAILVEVYACKSTGQFQWSIMTTRFLDSIYRAMISARTLNWAKKQWQLWFQWIWHESNYISELLIIPKYSHDTNIRNQ